MMKRGSSSSKYIKRKPTISHKLSLSTSPLTSKSSSPLPDRSATSIGYIQALDKQYHSVISKCEEMKLQIEYLGVKAGEFDIKHQELDRKCRGILSDNLLLKDKYEMLKAKTSQIKAEEATLNVRNSNCKTREAEASLRLDEVLKKVDKLARERNELGERCKDLKKEREMIKKKEADLAGENLQNDKQNTEIMRLKKEVMKLEAQYSSLKSYHDQVKEDYIQEQIKKQPLLQQQRDIDLKFTELKHQLQTYDKQKQNLDELQDQVLKDTEKFNKDMQYAEELKKDLENRHSHIIDHAKQLEAERDLLKSDRENLQAKVVHYDQRRRVRDGKRQTFLELKDQYLAVMRDTEHLKNSLKEKEELVSMFESEFKEREKVIEKRKIGLSEIKEEFTAKIRELEEREKALYSSISLTQSQIAYQSNMYDDQNIKKRQAINKKKVQDMLKEAERRERENKKREAEIRRKEMMRNGRRAKLKLKKSNSTGLNHCYTACTVQDNDPFNIV